MIFSPALQCEKAPTLSTSPTGKFPDGLTPEILTKDGIPKLLEKNKDVWEKVCTTAGKAPEK